MGYLDVFDSCGDGFCDVSALAAYQDHPGAAAGGVADEMHFFYTHVWQQADGEGTFASNIISEGARQEHLLDIIVRYAGFFL